MDSHELWQNWTATKNFATPHSYMQTKNSMITINPINHLILQSL